MDVTVQEQRGWTVLVAARLHVLVRWDAAAPGLERLRRAVSEGDVDEVLDALMTAGVRRAPDFVAVQEGLPARIVARGSAYAVVSGPTGEVTVRAAGRGPWTDEDAPHGARSIGLHTGEPEPHPVEQPVEQAPAPSGWRLPSRLGRGRATDGEPAAPAAAGADEVEELPSYDHLFGATQHGRPDPAVPHYIEAHDTDSLSEPGIGQAPVAAAGGFSAPAPQADQTLPPPDDTERARPAALRPAVSPAPPTVPTGPSAPAVPTPTPGALIDSVPWRSGGSNVAPPEPARHQPAQPPVRPAPVRPAGVHTPAPAPTLRPIGPPPSSPEAPPAAAAPPAPAAPPTAGVSLGDLDDLDDAEATVDRSALLAAAQAESGPLVAAVLCPAGHPSPPHAGTCRSCGREIPVQQPFQTARPPLGVLRLATGDVVALDRGVLLGRSPKVNAGLPAAERPHLVRVPSPENDISRNHLEVVLEGWHVLVRDLGSTNGTTVALPGQVPVRLRPGDQQVIEPGTILTMADEVSLTFEVGP
ncbi:FHA domain-containing protein [Knoellia sp. p5-6-4]|uniref:FHA domain-containing protein n=1 Tax=unclassified Knoellia TaxID=2618719 RepID=UPI0023D9DC6D|nr:FHA domain-containing protein [Knoellia sp. p5-6-4]MDF2145119.1 FHA domain-containing protein [Knoellia sp. p5-6-4]